MKIEIGESLIHSWLRHAHGCAVTQMSWKPSPTWTLAKEREIEAAFELVRKFASETIGIQIFRNGDFSQFIRQAEIDVLGIRWSSATAAPSVIAVDSAFHEYGLQYGNADETVGRVLKKLIRAAFALEAYLDVADASIIFATPKMAEPVLQSIRRHLAILEMRLAEQPVLIRARRHFHVIANLDFTHQILQPVMDKLDLVADTSELFIRAQQLGRLCESTPRRHTCPNTDRSSLGTRNHPSPVARKEEPRIGEHVRATMAQLAASGRLTARTIGDLLDASYCKAKFNLGLPFLKPVDKATSLQSQRIDQSGYSRYWKRPLRIGDHEFLMCSQWFVWQRGPFDSWVREIG